jgi:hypothetical protein
MGTPTEQHPDAHQATAPIEPASRFHHDLYTCVTTCATPPSRAASELGIETPELRWFKEMRSAYDSDPRPIVCGGLVLTPTFPGIVWLSVRAAMEPLTGLERTVWHECAHLAGYLSEDEADRVAARHVDGGETPCRDRGDEIRWIPSRAPVGTNYWELRTA